MPHNAPVLELPQVGRVLHQAMSGGGHYADIFAEHTTVLSLELEDQKVSQAQQALLCGAGIRVLRGATTGYAYTMDLQLPALLQAARFAATVGDGATAGAVAHRWGTMQMPLQEADDSVTHFAQQLLALDATVRALDARVVRVKAAISTRQQQILFANSLGEQHTQCRPLVSVYLRVVMEQNGRSEMGFASQALRMPAHQLGQDQLLALAHTAVSRAAFLFTAVQPQGGEMPVVMAPGASGILLHEAIGHAFEADFNMARTSIFADSLGKSICHPSITIVDDGTQPGDVGHLQWDDEGVPGQRTVLVDHGVLASYMHDRITAAHYGVQPTGNGRRESFRHQPQPRMRSTLMLAGEAQPHDVIRSVKRGVYAQVFTNGQVQIGAGDFTFYMKQGYLIEDGHLTQPLRDVNITGNGPRALRDISMVGCDLKIDHSASMCGKGGQSVPVSQGLPTVKVDHLVVG